MAVLLSFLLFISALPPFSLPGPGLFFLIPFFILSLKDKRKVFLNGLLLSLAISTYLFYGIISYNIGVYILIVFLFTLSFITFLLISFLLIIHNPVRSIIIIPGIWLLIELIFNSLHIPITLALLTTPMPSIYSLVSFGGQSLLSLLMVLLQVLFVIVWLKLHIGNKRMIWIIPGLIGIGFHLVFNTQSLSINKNEPVSVTLLQTNIHPHLSLSLAADGIIESLDKHRNDLFLQAVSKSSTDMVVLPEVNIANYELLNIYNIRWLAKKFNTSILLYSPHRSEDGREHQSVFSINNNGDILQRKDKQLLIPILEKEFHTTDIKRWEPHNDLPGKPGSLICFESAFSLPAVELTRNGAGFLTISTNDAYAGPSILPMIHFEIARIRAMETGRTIVRTANAGISAIISPEGIVQKHLGLYKEGIIKTVVKPHYKLTFFAKYYWQWQIIYWVTGLISLILLIHMINESCFTRLNVTYSYHYAVTLIWVFIVILLQHFTMLSLYELRSNKSVKNVFSTFQTISIFTPYYTHLLTDKNISSIDSALTYVLRSYGNNITVNQIKDHYSGLAYQYKIPVILNTYRLYVEEIDYQRCVNRITCIRNNALVLLKHGEMVVIKEISKRTTLFFSPHYARIMMVTTDAFANEITDQAWNITPIPLQSTKSTDS